MELKLIFILHNHDIELCNCNLYFNVPRALQALRASSAIYRGGTHTKKLLVNALVMPYFHYCSPAWSNAAPFRLSKINKKVVDASVFLGREDNYSIYNMLDKDISLLTFKALNNIAPNYLCSKIQMAKNCHSHNTRRAAKNHLQIPSSNTKFGMRTFAYRASKLWNDLPNELLDIKSLLKFKTSVKDFFN